LVYVLNVSLWLVVSWLSKHFQSKGYKLVVVFGLKTYSMGLANAVIGTLTECANLHWRDKSLNFLVYIHRHTLVRRLIRYETLCY